MNWNRMQQRVSIPAYLALLLACGVAVQAVDPNWQTYHASIRQLPQSPNGTVGDSLGAVLDWPYSMPMDAIRRGTSYRGASRRLRRVVADMQAGKPVSVLVLGGSISAGAGATRKNAASNPNDVWSLVRLWLQNNVSSTISFANNARSATKSYVQSQCVDRFLPPGVDLVFMEFIANDGSEMDSTYSDSTKTRSYERFMRKILSQPTAPALVMAQMLIEGQAFPPEGMSGKPKMAYYQTPEDNLGNLAQYYGVPTVSYRNMMWPICESGSASWLDYQMPDRLHPNDKGHKAIADMIVYLLQEVAVDLALHPVSPEDMATTKTPLPPPMYGSDNEIGSMAYAKCLQGQNLTQVAVTTDSWSMVSGGGNANYPTYGYETSSKGKPLTLEVNTQSPSGRPVSATLYYSKAYTGIGGYQISCNNGCDCGSTYIDGKLPYQQQVTFLNTLKPSAAPKCHINIELASNSTAGDKLRVTGLVLTADPDSFTDDRIGEEKYLGWLAGTVWAA